MSKLAINGGAKVRETPFTSWPIWDESDVAAVADVVRSGKWWSVGGTKVKEFEAAFAEYVDCKHGVCVPNGTLALLVGLKALGRSSRAPRPVQANRSSVCLQCRCSPTECA